MQFTCCFLYTGSLSGQTGEPADSAGSQMDTFRISPDAIDDIIEYSADDSTMFDLKARKAVLWGNARVKYEGMDLRAYMITVDFGKRELYARGRINDSDGRYTGRPVFNDGERETEADTMIYNFETKRGRTYGIAMKEGEGYILCNKVFRDDDKSIYSDLGKYTTCNNREHPHFYLQSRNLKIIPEKKIIFGPSNLYIEGIPTPLFIPFGMFPTKKEKKSGIIPFEYGSSGLYGPYLRNFGYHFAISDYLDESLTGDLYFRGSWRLASNTRYARRYRYNGNFSAEFSRYLNGEREDPDFKTNTTRTFRFSWRHTQDPKARPGTSFSANVDVQKNNAARLNSFNPTVIVSNEFGSSVSFSRAIASNRLNLSMNALHRQNTQTNAFSMTLPNVTLSMQRITPWSKPDAIGKYKWYKDFGISYIFEMENRIDTRDSIFFSGKPFEDIIPGFRVSNSSILLPTDRFRQGIVHSLPLTLGSYKLFKNHFSLTPGVTYREYWYFRTIEKNWNPALAKTDTVYRDEFSRASEYSTSLNLVTQVFGTFQFGAGKVSAVRHTVSPNLGLSYRPDFTEARYGYYREVQTDTLGNTSMYSIYEQGIKGGPGGGPSGLLNFSVGNNIQAKVLKTTDSSRTYQNVTWLENLTVTGNYNFLSDSMKLSNIGVNAFTRLFNQINLNANAGMNPYASRNTERGQVYYNRLLWNESRRIGTWTNAGFQIASAFNADMFRKKTKDTSGLITSDEEKREYAEMMSNPYGYVDFSIPWNLQVNYSFNYIRSNYRTAINQTFTVGGDFNLSPKWKIGCNTGYDFAMKRIAYTQFEVSRLLHCWALNFSWIPDGIRKSFNFSLKVNSSMLQSLKVDKKRYWFDQ